MFYILHATCSKKYATIEKKNVYFCCKSSNLFIYVSYLFSKFIFYQFRWRYKYFNCSSCKHLFYSLLYINSIVWNVENYTKDVLLLSYICWKNIRFIFTTFHMFINPTRSTGPIIKILILVLDKYIHLINFNQTWYEIFFWI